MSVVLYLLGAGLLAWSGLMLLQGDAFATLDIATRLAGAGVLAIGLGAVTGALRRLGRIVAGAADGLPAREAGEGGLMSVLAGGRKPGAAKPAPRPLPRAPSRPEPAPDPAPAAEAERPAAPAAEPPPGKPAAPPVLRPEVREPRVEEPRRPKARPAAATPASAAFAPPLVVAPMLGGLAAPQPARPEPPAAPVRERDDAPEASEKIEIEAATPPAPAPEPKAVSAAVAEPAPDELAAEAVTAPAGPEPKETAAPAPMDTPAQPEPAADAAAGTKRAPPPDWLVRARERREARARGERKEPRLDAPPPPEPEEPAPAPETSAPAEEIAEPDASAAGPRLVREGELKGVTYRFFDDGSVEAESPHGRRRFGSVEELRKTVLAARGGVFDPADEPEEIEETDEPVVAQPEDDDDRPRFRSAPEEPPPLSAGPADRMSEDPLDAAIAELEQGAPQLRR